MLLVLRGKENSFGRRLAIFGILGTRASSLRDGPFKVDRMLRGWGLGFGDSV